MLDASSPTALLLAWMGPLWAEFTAPTARHALVLVTGAVLAPAQRTVATALRTTGYGQAADFTNYHRGACRKVFPRTIRKGIAFRGTCSDQLLIEFWPSESPVHNQKLGYAAFSRSSHTGLKNFATGPARRGLQTRLGAGPAQTSKIWLEAAQRSPHGTAEAAKTAHRT